MALDDFAVLGRIEEIREDLRTVETPAGSQPYRKGFKDACKQLRDKLERASEGRYLTDTPGIRQALTSVYEAHLGDGTDNGLIDMDAWGPWDDGYMAAMKLFMPRLSDLVVRMDAA
jgi:hypothetical protein